MSIGAFSIGYPFNYWSQYEWGMNSYYHETNGMDEHYIKPKYNNFEEEIRNYDHINFIRHYKQEILNKAEIYINTFTIKSLTHANRHCS